MEQKEKEMIEAQEVAMMAIGSGWTIVQEYINKQIKPIEDRIFNDDLTQEEFNLLRRERRAYKDILDFVERRVEKVKNQKNN